MKPSHKLLFFLISFSTGIIIPVLSLVLLSHGASLQTLSLCIGIISGIVVIMELPSGILTDIWGRKRIFLLSHFFILINFIIIIFSNHLIPLAVACVFLGLGKAFSSGTIELIEIENFIRENGSDNLSKINSSLAIIDSTGLALGSLFGGFIGYIDPHYTILLFLCISFEIILLLFSINLIKEERIFNASKKVITLLKEQIKNIEHTLYESKFIKAILLSSTLLGIGLSAVEVYWQPSLEIFLPKNLGWIYGIISCIGYFGVIVGNQVAEIVWKHISMPKKSINSIRYYWTLRLCLPFLIFLLGFCRNVICFLIIYMLIYTILGAGNLFENTIFHKSISNTNRSSMVSISSLFLQGGGIITSILGNIILTHFNLLFMWILLPFIMLLGTILISHYSMKYKNQIKK